MFRYLSLKKCVQLYMVVIGLISIVLFGFYSHYLLKNISERYAASIANSTVESFFANNHGNIVSNNYFELQKNLDKIFSEPQTTYLSFYDKDTNEIYGRSKISNPPNMQNSESSAILRKEGVINVKKTFKLPGTQGDIGHIIWGINNKAVDGFFAQYRYGCIIFLVMLLIGMIILARYSATILFKSLDKIREAFSKVSSFEAKSLNDDEYRFDEVKTIAREYNAMLLRFRDYEKRIESNAELAAIGQSASMIAHDVRKPLTGLKSLLVLLPEKRDDDEFIRDMSRDIDKTINQTNAMLSEILEFSKDATSLVRKVCDPQSLITAVLSDVFTGRSDLDVSIEYDLKHKNYLNIDSDRIIRVLANITGNAVEAMEGRGKIWIKTKDIYPLMGITIGNNGPVIPEDVQKRLFEPFFTKGKKGGTGLGLAICQKIIDMHGGKLQVSSNKSQGGDNVTEFVIELPASEGNLSVNEAELIRHSNEMKHFREEEAAREEYGDSANAREFMRLHKEHGGTFYLLIVDDEPLFRETVQGLLRKIPEARDHVKVVESGSAEEALTLFNACVFDYVIADIDMGKNKMDGYEFARVVLERYPNTCVLIHSNKRRDEMDRGIREMDSPRFMGFLPKPMKSSELLQFLAGKSFESVRVDKPTSERKALVLNDDDSFLVTMRILLKKHGISVTGVTNVQQAIEKFKSGKVDIILSDINLGDSEADGYEFLRHVRSRDQNIPFYIVSGYSDKEEGPKAKGMGATGYLQVPFENEQLKEILQ